MSRVFFLFGFLLASSLVFAQETAFRGKVIDANSKEGVPYAHLILPELKRGTSADVHGDFRFEAGDVAQSMQVLVSSVGYVTRTLSLGAMSETIALQPSLNALREVVIYDLQDHRSKRINPFVGAKIVGLGNFSGGAYPSALARYYARPKKFDQGCFLKNLEIDFYRVLGADNPAAKFRLRILEVAEDGLPGIDLLDDGLVLEKPENAAKMKVNMLPYKLNVPSEGVYIVVEHLFIPENKFTEILSVQNNEGYYINYEVERYAPIFKGVEIAKNQSNPRCFYKSLTGWKPVTQLDTAGSALAGNAPAPAFKVLFID